MRRPKKDIPVRLVVLYELSQILCQLAVVARIDSSKSLSADQIRLDTHNVEFHCHMRTGGKVETASFRVSPQKEVRGLQSDKVGESLVDLLNKIECMAFGRMPANWLEFDGLEKRKPRQVRGQEAFANAISRRLYTTYLIVDLSEVCHSYWQFRALHHTTFSATEQ